MKSLATYNGHAKLAKDNHTPLTSLVIILALVAVISVSGCAGLTTAGSPATNGNPSNAAGSLAASATSLSFGNVATGASSSQTLTLTNSGAATIVISQATITGSSFTVVGGMSSISIAAGQSHAFQVQFAPQAAGSATGSMIIASNAGTSSLSVSLSGMGTSSLSITSQPLSESVAVGQTGNFIVAATGNGTLTYQWKKNGVAISNGTGPTYMTPPTVSSDNGALFTAVVTDNSGSVTTSAATLTVTSSPVAPSITTQPVGQTVTAGQAATFAVAATGTANLAYQWSKNGAAINGATGTSYTTPATTASDDGSNFAVTVTNGAGTVTSNAAKLTVNVSSALLNASATTLNFANVNLGSSSVLGVTLTNAGNTNVNVSGVSISGAGYSASGVSTGQIVSPGQTATLNVTFTPSATGSVPGSVTVASNASNSPSSISLSGIGVQVTSHSATLNWNASASAVSGYNAYRSTTSGGPYTKVSSSMTASTSYADAAVQGGQTYYYVVTSVNSSGAESAYSNEASAAIPAN